MGSLQQTSTLLPLAEFRQGCGKDLLVCCFIVTISTYNEWDSLLLLDRTETDPGVDHHAVEVTVHFRHTLHGAGASDEGLSGGRTVVDDWLASWWRLGGHLGAGDHCVGGQVGGKALRKVLLDVDWSRCGLTGVGLWSGITSDRTSDYKIYFVLFSQNN